MLNWEKGQFTKLNDLERDPFEHKHKIYRTWYAIKQGNTFRATKRDNYLKKIRKNITINKE